MGVLVRQPWKEAMKNYGGYEWILNKTPGSTAIIVDEDVDKEVEEAKVKYLVYCTKNVDLV